jgi:4-aminobutyrate aminotransferase-like enzyme
VRFVSFPKAECDDVARRGEAFDVSRYRAELEQIKNEGAGIACLITEPYLGGGGSFHPPHAYLQELQAFCRENGILFILDEIQANFGRTGHMFAFETYGSNPTSWYWARGSATVCRRRAPWARHAPSAHWSTVRAPIRSVRIRSAAPPCSRRSTSSRARTSLALARRSSADHRGRAAGVEALPFVTHVRGESGGMVWGVEVAGFDGQTANEVANACVLAAYRGDDQGRAVHLMGPLAKCVIRIAPPLTITATEARDSVDALGACLRAVPAYRAAAL